MADYGNNKKQTASGTRANNETALMIEGLYNGIAFDLQKIKKELLNELKYSSLQAGSVYQAIQQETATAIEGMQKNLGEAREQFKAETVASFEELKKDVEEAREQLKAETAAAVAKNSETSDGLLTELKYGYRQNETIFETLSSILNNEVLVKLGSVESKTDLIVQIDEALKLLGEKVDELLSKSETDYEAIAETMKEKVIDALPVPEYIDYDKITDTVTESVNEKVENGLNTKSQEILDAVAAIPVPENVDYTRIVEEVSDKVLEKINERLANEEKEPAPEFDYDRVIYGAAEKVVESLPYPEKVDYRRIEEGFTKEAEGLKVTFDEDAMNAKIEEAVKNAIAGIDYDAIAEAVAAKVVVPEVQPQEVDYEQLSDMIIAKMPTPVEPEPIDYDKLADAVIAKMPTPVEPEPIDYDKLADAVIAKMPAPVEPEPIDYDKLADAVIAKMPAPVEPEPIDYDKLADVVIAKMPAPVEPEAVDYDKLAVLMAAKVVIPEAEAPTYEMLVDEEGVKAIAEKVAEILNYDELAEKTAEKVSEPSYEMLLDEEGINAIADAVAEKMQGCCFAAAAEEVQETPVEEAPAEEETETITEEIAEEAQAEPEEEVQEEPVEVEVEEQPAVSELAVASTLAQDTEENPNELVDADTGLVLRLKKSFKAKLRQSTPEVKSYYSTVKNALSCYKRLNSNISWHGDRFNFGRETVARMNISGKTLCFYIALDPTDPEYKTTVYHQKDVSNHKAYENTPFMIKVKSETGAKRAARLVGFLAEKLGAEKKSNFEPVDYVEEFSYASTKQLLDEGLIKVTKEKKVVLDFN